MRAVLARNLKKYIFTSLPPLGLAYLASALKKDGVETALIDVGHKGYTRERLLTELRRDPPDIVGVASYSRDYADTKLLIEEMAAFLPKSTAVVMGGPHPSSLPVQTLETIPRVDYAVVGEAERSLPMLARILAGKSSDKKADVSGLVWRENGSIRCNAQSFIEDLDALGHIDWDALEPRSYHGENLAGGSKRAPAAIMVTHRGCPFRCEFCTDYLLFGRKVRRHGIDYVMQDIETLHEKFGFPEIRIVDDNFPSNREYVLKFCGEVRKKNWDLLFSFPLGMHLALLDAEILDALKSIGLYEITLGIESASPRILDLMKKSQTPALIREKVRLIHSKGIDIIGLFILGYPTETEEEARRTIDMTLELPLTRAHFHHFMPFPGTPVTKMLQDAGRMQTVKWEHWHFDRVHYSFCDIPLKKLYRLRVEAILRFYLRPRKFWKLMTKWRNLAQLRFFLHKLLEYA